MGISMIEPAKIDPNAVYSDGDLRIILGVTSATTAAARRSGALRFSRLGKQTIHRGTWVLDWIESTSAIKALEHCEVSPGQGGGH
jgi:hypothetical protein